MVSPQVRVPVCQFVFDLYMITPSFKDVLVGMGAAIGGGIGMAYGAYYCSELRDPDCAGGPARGARFIGSTGAAVGAGAGLALAAIKKR
jgi:hypothetical protein